MKLISQAVKKFLDSNEVPDGLWSQVGEEGHFSWLPCEVCSSNLGGTRFDVEFVTHSLPEGKFTLPVCTNCLTYMESVEDGSIAINHKGSLRRWFKGTTEIECHGCTDPTAHTPADLGIDGLRKKQ